MDQLIRDLQERESVSFEEAQYFLKKTNGDIDKAVALIQKKQNSLWRRFKNKIKYFILGFWEYHFIIYKGERTFLNVPLLIGLILIFILDLGGIEFAILCFILMLIIIGSGAEVSFSRVKNNINTLNSNYNYNVEKGNSVRVGLSEKKLDFQAAKSKMEGSLQKVENFSKEQEDYTEIIIK